MCVKWLFTIPHEILSLVYLTQLPLGFSVSAHNGVEYEYMNQSNRFYTSRLFQFLVSQSLMFFRQANNRNKAFNGGICVHSVLWREKNGAIHFCLLCVRLLSVIFFLVENTM